MDERLQQLARRWQESGTLEDEVALLRERQRAGVLPDGGLELASFLGHAAARELRPKASDRAKLLYPATTRELERWLGRLSAHGEVVMLRAGAAAARAAFLDPYGRPLAGEGQLSALEDWILCPCEAHLASLDRSRAEPAPAPVAAFAGYLDLARQALNGVHVEYRCRVLVTAIREELIPWATGQRDPLRERASAPPSPPTEKPDLPF